MVDVIGVTLVGVGWWSWFGAWGRTMEKTLLITFTRFVASPEI